MKKSLTLAALFASTLGAFAQGTAFTYQGRLNDGATPANGSYDTTFSVWDAASGPTQVGGPLTSTATAVSNGLFTVTLDFGPGIFTGAERWLELGVRTNGGGAFVTLSPRQPLTATPYAIAAGNVTGPINGSAIINGSISSAQLASGAVTAAHIASNSITSSQLADGSVGAAQLASGAAAANLNASSQSGVASGGLVLSLTGNNSALVTAGYVRIGMTATPDIWLPLDPGPIPAGRQWHTAVWTGSEMILWGGQKSGGAGLSDGWRYNPEANSWTAVSTNGAPTARYWHTAVWTGSEMIVWGGIGGSGYLNGGARYNPANDSWTPVTTNGAPAARSQHTAVWTGSEMLIWGGVSGFTGGRYNPADDSWTEISTTNTVLTRYGHTAVWTGTEMIVWGGYMEVNNYLNDGGRYNPSSNTWTLMVGLPNAPTGRMNHTAVWTGSEMIVWGGYGSSSGYVNNGGFYNPASNSWTGFPNSLPNTPAARLSHTAVWTGSEMIVWGGNGSGGLPNGTGARYNPVGNRWLPVSTIGSPAARMYHAAVWTGNEMIVSGGTAGSSPLGDTFSHMLGRMLYLYQRP